MDDDHATQDGEGRAAGYHDRGNHRLEPSRDGLWLHFDPFFIVALPHFFPFATPLIVATSHKHATNSKSAVRDTKAGLRGT